MIKGKTEKDIQLQGILRKVTPTKDMFNTVSGKQAFSNDYKLLNPYILETSFQSTIAGNAFDYLMRFIIARSVACDKQRVYEGIVAETGLRMLEGVVDKDTYKILNDKYIQAIELISKFVLGNNADDKGLIPAACYLGRLDVIRRTGKPPIDIKDSLIDDEAPCLINDLTLLLDVFRDNFINSGLVRTDSDVVFNPTFGLFTSSVIRGADADIYMDGILYDIKTTKNNGFKWQHSAQLIGYYILNEVAKDIEISNLHAPLISREINRVAFYKPRFGEIEYVDIKDLEYSIIAQATQEIKEMGGFA
jgi:hypothetical protein